MTLTAKQLTKFRTSFADQVLDQTCTIQRGTRTSDGMGSFTTSWANSYTNVDCRLARDMKNEVIVLEADTIRYIQPWRLHVKFDQDILPGDRVVVGSDTFEVLGVADAQQWMELKTAAMREYQVGSAGGGGAIASIETYKVKVTADDATGDYLLAKLAAGAGITLTETTPGGNEDVTIAVHGVPTAASNPGTPAEGDINLNTTDDSLYIAVTT